MIAAAIGLRTEFSVQAKSTAPGSSSPLGPRNGSALQMQHAKEREEPASGIEIDVDLALEALFQKRRAFVVQAAPPHVERFDLMRGRIADRLEIAFADEEIVLDDAAERRQRKHQPAVRLAALEAYIEDKAILLQGEDEPVGTALRIARRETVGFEQIVNGDFAFLLDLPGAANERPLIQLHCNQAESGFAQADFTRRRGVQNTNMVVIPA